MISKTKNKNSERGIALIVAMLALLLISVIAVGLMVSSNTETSISANFRDEQVAFFSARGGLDEVRDRMRLGTPNSLNGSLPLPNLGAANGVLYVTDGSSTPWTGSGPYGDTEICKEGLTCPASGTWYTQTVASNSYAAAPPLAWRWVRITNKMDNGTYSVNGIPSGLPVCWNGANEATATAPTLTCDPVNNPQVYMLTALAVTNSGSRRMVQYEVAKVGVPPVPGAIVFDGPNPVFNAPNSNAFTVTGIDQHVGPPGGGCTTTKQDKAGLAGFDPGSVVTLTGDVSKRPGSYTGSSGLTPDVQNEGSALKNQTTVDGLQALVNNITSEANAVYPVSNPSGVNLGTPAAPMINVIQGDFTLGGGTTGTGILLVTGTLTMNGNPGFNGIILVIGKGQIVKNGGGNGVVNGSLFVANMNDSSGKPIPLGASPPNAPGSPSIDWNGGGNATIQYDSCWIQAVSGRVPYKVLATREVVY